MVLATAINRHPSKQSLRCHFLYAFDCDMLVHTKTTKNILGHLAVPFTAFLNLHLPFPPQEALSFLVIPLISTSNSETSQTYSSALLRISAALHNFPGRLPHN